MFRQWVLPWIVWTFYRCLTWSWRIHLEVHPDVLEAQKKNEPLILAHWHGDELAVLHLVRPFKIATMTSTSKDGQLIDFVIRKFGGATSKGSSTRGAVSALKGLVRLSKQGYSPSMAVDGPKGPLHVVKPGVFELSRLTKARIVPVGSYAKSAWCFEKSWNKTYLPKPFSRVSIQFGKPINAITRDQDPKAGSHQQLLSDQIFAAQRQARAVIAQ